MSSNPYAPYRPIRNSLKQSILKTEVYSINYKKYCNKVSLYP